MADITMCSREDCPLAEKCRRNPASGTRPNPHAQSWVVWPYEPGEGCDAFYPMEGDDA